MKGHEHQLQRAGLLYTGQFINNSIISQNVKKKKKDEEIKSMSIAVMPKSQDFVHHFQAMKLVSNFCLYHPTDGNMYLL